MEGDYNFVTFLRVKISGSMKFSQWKFTSVPIQTVNGVWSGALIKVSHLLKTGQCLAHNPHQTLRHADFLCSVTCIVYMYNLKIININDIFCI